MTAGTSVLGLFNNGAGAVDGENKGSERMTLAVEKLIGPKVVAAGQVNCAALGDTVVSVAGLELPIHDDIVGMLSFEDAVAANTPYVSAYADSGGHLSTFTITNPNAGIITTNWMIVRVTEGRERP